MKIKRLFAILAAIIVLAMGLSFFISSGYKKRPDVCVQNYWVSEDGSSIIIQTSLAGSMGYIREIETVRDGDAVYCSFYCAFGGLNSGIGSKNRFEIKLDPASAKIYFDRGSEGNELVLQKDEATNTWVRAPIN